jgi:nitrate reductase molybdenum cofactor assembly chaperone NarJ/NarW
MIRVASDPFDQISQFLEYPVEGLREALAEFPNRVRERFPEAASHLETYLKGTQDLSLTEMEELFTRTFDINPACTLELGWILYGQQYERGAFLVRMRELLRSQEVEEKGELPDHLTYVLRALGKMPEDEARSFCEKEVIPALVKMRAGFEDGGNPYTSVIEAVQSALNLFAESNGSDLPSSSEAGK